jgi:hypothetical protein
MTQVTRELIELAERVEKAEVSDNALDVLVEIALFEPVGRYVSVRANAAGTKAIYTMADKSQLTTWADDWTIASRREATVAALRARSAATL